MTSQYLQPPSQHRLSSMSYRYSPSNNSFGNPYPYSNAPTSPYPSSNYSQRWGGSRYGQSPDVHGYYSPLASPGLQQVGHHHSYHSPRHGAVYVANGSNRRHHRVCVPHRYGRLSSSYHILQVYLHRRLGFFDRLRRLFGFDRRHHHRSHYIDARTGAEVDRHGRPMYKFWSSLAVSYLICFACSVCQCHCNLYNTLHWAALCCMCPDIHYLLVCCEISRLSDSEC